MRPFAFASRRRSIPAFLLLPVVLLGVSFTLSLNAQASASGSDDRTYRIDTSSNVDPNLFPLYVHGSLYGRLPAVSASGAEQSQWISSTRSEAHRMRDIIRHRQLDPALDILYADCLEFTSVYEAFLEHSAQIRKTRETYVFGDALSGAIKGYQNGSDAQDVSRFFGASKDNASNVGAVAGILSGMGEIYSRNQQRDAAANAAIAAEARKLSDTWTATTEDGHVVLSRLSGKYGWARSEANFDALSSSSVGSYSAQMPRNPFAASSAAFSLSGKEKPSDLMERALRCFHAAELVPSDSVFGEYRSLFVYEAAALAVLAASREAGLGAYSAGPTASSGTAVQYVRTYLSLDQEDSGGAGHILLARALGLAGRYSEAVEADNKAFQIAPRNEDSSEVAIRYAALLSLTGLVDNSAQWLSRAYSLGFNNLAWVQQDPDLRNLRRERAQLFTQLTSIRLTTPQFIWGLLLDDAQLRNDSRFDITNLSVKVVIRKGGSHYSFTMQCPVVKAGATCRADNVTSIPGDSYDDLQWSYTSDQGKS